MKKSRIVHEVSDNGVACVGREVAHHYRHDFAVGALRLRTTKESQVPPHTKGDVR